MGNLPASAPYWEMTPSPSAVKVPVALQLMVLMCPTPIHAGKSTVWILCGFSAGKLDGVSSWVKSTFHMWTTAFPSVPVDPEALTHPPALLWCILTLQDRDDINVPFNAQDSKLTYSQHCDQWRVNTHCCLLHKEIIWPRSRAALIYVYKSIKISKAVWQHACPFSKTAV